MMIKKIGLLLFNFAVFSSYTMQMTTDIQWKNWVQTAAIIKIKNINFTHELNIQNNTTIGDLKENLLDREGIPTHQQSLRAIMSNPMTLWLTHKYSQELQNSCLVKDVMHEYNTDCLALHLKLRSRDNNPS